MPRFLDQPDSIDGYEFNSIPIDIHIGIVKNPTIETHNDYTENNTKPYLWEQTEKRSQIKYRQ
jgi:hypothetical protein